MSARNEGLRQLAGNPGCDKGVDAVKLTASVSSLLAL
jgi:hypothetical protein